MDFSYRQEYAEYLDGEDALASLRDQFVVDDPELIYLDGNSLGRLPKKSKALAEEIIEKEWGRELVGGWKQGWLELSERIGDKLAELLGAERGEIIIADSTSVNLFKLAGAVLRYQEGKNKIITDDLNFPSDVHIINGLIDFQDGGHTLEIMRSADGIHGPVEELLTGIDENTALVTLSHTAFKSAYTYEMKEITQAAQNAGALMLWDLSHSAGAVPINLKAAGVDLAVGCTYKYINGGPGAPAFLYVSENLQKQLTNPLTGWMGSGNMFDFSLEYEADTGIRRFLTGTPPILSMALIEPGLDILLEATPIKIREKSVRQTEYLIRLWESELASLGFSLNSPREADFRGAHVSLSHKHAAAIDMALIHEHKVLPDFRAPDNLRLGLSPLYTKYVEIFLAVEKMKMIVQDKSYEKYVGKMTKVT